MKKILFIMIILTTVFFNTGFAYSNELNINAQSYILIEAHTGQVLFEHNPDEILYPASTTKILTGALALEKGDMRQMMEASEAAVYDIGKDGMNIGIMPGEVICMEDLVNAMLVRSANETANILAENISKNRQEFVDLMNKKAKNLGAANTHFANPCGAHDDNHYTTARDMALIARYAITVPGFKEIVKKTEYKMSSTNKHTEEQWGTLLYSTNKLLINNPNESFDITGMKTGYTNPAGHCLVSSAVNSEGIELISVVMGVRNTGSNNSIFEFSEQLLEYGYKNYKTQDIILADQVIKSGVSVIDAKEPTIINLVAETGLQALLPVDKNNWNIDTEEHLTSLIKAPVVKGEYLGYIKYKRGGTTLGKVNVTANKAVEGKETAEVKVQRIENNVLQNPVFIKVSVITLIVLISFMALRILLKTISRKIKAKKRNKHKF